MSKFFLGSICGSLITFIACWFGFSFYGLSRSTRTPSNRLSLLDIIQDQRKHILYLEERIKHVTKLLIDERSR